MNKVVVGLILALCVLHHDIWWWDTAEPVLFGFMPIGLFWHALISLAAGVFWWLVVVNAWPSNLDDVDSD